jgi:hypothetical protein
MNKRYALAVAAVAAVAVGAALLGSAFTTESTSEAKQGFCQSLSDFSTAVTTFDNLSPATATQDEIDAAYADVQSAWNDVQDEGNDWINAYDNPLTNAYWDFYYAAEDLPGGNTAAENLDELQPELAAFPQAIADTFDGTGC